MRRFAVHLSVVLLACLTSPAVRANGRPANSTGVAVQPGNPNKLMVSVTFGMVFSQDAGDSWYWACEEVLGGPTGSDNSLAWLANDTLVVLNPLGVFVSADLGCTWNGISTFTPTSPEGLCVHPTKADTLYVVVNAQVSNTNLGSVYRSEDSAQTFQKIYTPTGANPPLFTSVVMSPANPNRIYVGGFFEESPLGAVVVRSDDAGSTWTNYPVSVGPNPNYAITPTIGVSPTDANVVLLAVIDASKDQAMVLRSADGGQTMTQVHSPMQEIREFAWAADGQTVWAAGTQYIFRSTDAGKTFTALPRPTSNACATYGNSRLYGCGGAYRNPNDLNAAVSDGYALASSTDDGNNWLPIFNLADIKGPVSCPADSAVTTQCGPVWPNQQTFDQNYVFGPYVGDANIIDPNATTNPNAPAADTKKSGCNCAQGGLGGLDGLAMAFGALSVLRRKRRLE